jgi:FAD/FMN-containing dehydrogenase/Fe-S oxidoreductase
VAYLTNKATLTAYASDGSIYADQPFAIRQVLTPHDVIESIKYARENHLSLTPRGGGTGLAGGAVGSGIILDYSRLKNIIEIDTQNQIVRIEVGIIYDELNLTLKKHNLFFPPDPSSGDSCQIGGMLANNSSGPRSVKYGLTSDFVEELTVIDASGKLLNLKKMKLDSDELESFFTDNPNFREIYNLLKDNIQLIKEKWPKLKKNSAGFNLFQVINDFEQGIFNLPALMVGSEGTLCLFLSAGLRLLPIPSEKLTVGLYFQSLVEAGRAVAPILELGPSGLEIVDGSTLDLIGRQKFDIPENAAALLLVEFDDNIERRKADFEKLMNSLTLAAPPAYADNTECTAALWRARKSIVPTLYRHHKTRRPISLIEDVSIPPEKIPEFIEYITSLFNKYNLTFGIFGHIGDGNLHIRPLLDLNKSDEFELARQLYDTVYDKVISIGGSITAEHADGRLRASLLRKLYGDQIFDIFKQIKKRLDPDNILSPDSELSEVPFTHNIDYEKIKLYCAACGKCNGYCPAYDIFRREDFSPRGWLRILNQSDESRKNLDQFLSFCLNCKNCATVCPAGVDIASEIINYRSQKPSAISTTAVELTDSDIFLNLSLRIGKLFEPIMKSRAGKSMASIFGGGLFGLDKSIQFPTIAKKSLRNRYPEKVASSGDIALFHGCADNLLQSNVGDAVFRLFDYLGINLSMPDQKCCGLPQEVYGHRDNLIEKARFNIDHLKHFDAVITGCASCLLKLKEYKELFDDSDPYKQAAEQLADKCFDISQYLNFADVDLSQFDGGPELNVTYHNPCHLRRAGLRQEPLKLMSRLENIKIHHPLYADRCCAQAGSYGYVHYQESKKMFAKKKKDYLNIDANIIMTSCPACRMKIDAEMEGKYRVVHPVEILAERIKK